MVLDKPHYHVMKSLEHPWLEGLETPYFWRPSDSLAPRERAELLLRLQERDQEWEDNEYLTFTRFVINLLLGYELFATANDAASAMSRLGQLEMELFEMDIVSNCSFFRQTRRAQWHVMLASRAVLLACMGHLDQSRQVVDVNFDSVVCFNPVENAAIRGIKSRTYLECGPTARSQALEWARAAVLMNPNEAEWNFLVGETLERTRQHTGNVTTIPVEEILYLEKAVALGGRGHHKVHLANVYDRLARQIQIEDLKSETFSFLVKNLTSRSFNLLQDALVNAGNNTELLLRGVKGLLRRPHRNAAKEDLRRIMHELFSQAKKTKIFFDVAGTYYLKLEGDKQKSLGYFKEGSKLGDYFCSKKALRLQLKLGQVTDTEKALRQLGERYKNNKEYHEDALGHLGAWLLLKKRDLGGALGIINTILKRNKDCRSLVDLKPIFLHCPSPLDILHAMYEEMRLAPTGSLPPQEQDYFLKFIIAHRPNIISQPSETQQLNADVPGHTN